MPAALPTPPGQATTYQVKRAFGRPAITVQELRELTVACNSCRVPRTAGSGEATARSSGALSRGQRQVWRPTTRGRAPPVGFCGDRVLVASLMPGVVCVSFSLSLNPLRTDTRLGRSGPVPHLRPAA